MEIPRIAELNRVIAGSLVRKPGRLTGPEIRFLRKHLGWSGVDFARRMMVKKETVSRWETEARPMGPQAELALRLLAAVAAPIGDYASLLDDLEGVAMEPRHVEALRLRASEAGWEPASASC